MKGIPRGVGVLLPIIVMAVGLSRTAMASGPELMVPEREYPLYECLVKASRSYSIPMEFLWAIASVESNLNPQARGQNPNGTYDIGVMQINSSHLDRLSTHNITANRLINEPCLNIHVGAWILRENIERYGMTWHAVGAYNASHHRPDLRLKYARKVREKIVHLLAWRKDKA